MFADAPMLLAADPAEALRSEIAARGCGPQLRGVAIAMRLAECMPARGQRDGFLVVHRHAREGFLHVARHAFVIVRIALRSFGVDVDQPHLDRRERSLDHFEAVLGIDARLHAFVHPLVFAAPIDVAFGFIDIDAAAAETEDRTAHAFDRHIAGEDEQIGPADLVAIFLLDRPKQAPRLVEIAVVGPAVERRETLLPAIGAAAAIGGAVGTRGVPRHADEEGPIMTIVGGPPRLAVGH